MASTSFAAYTAGRSGRNASRSSDARGLIPADSHVRPQPASDEALSDIYVYV